MPLKRKSGDLLKRIAYPALRRKTPDNGEVST